MPRTDSISPSLFPLNPSGSFKLAWNYLTLLATGYYAMMLPYALASGQFLGEIHPHDVTLSSVLTLIFFLDLGVNFHTAYVRDGQLEIDSRAIRRRYLRRWFGVDLIASIPFDLFALMAGHGDWAVVLMALRLLRLLKAPSLFHRDNLLRGHGPLERLTLMLFWVVLSIHLIGCLWMVIHPSPPEDGELTRYIKAVYWTITTLASVGYGDITPTTDGGRLFAMLVMLIGVGLYGVVIGNVSMLLVNTNAHEMRQKEKLAGIANFMERYQVPRAVQLDVFSYFSHFLLERSPPDEQILADMPEKLREQLEMHINIHILEQVPLFRNMPKPCLEELAAAQKPMVFGPGEVIVRAGEVGREMYFLLHGVVHVLRPDGVPITKLYKHSFFGETALLENVERTATVKSATYCDLARLDRDDFLRIVEAYPALKAELEAQSRLRMSASSPQGR
ncbi:MAG: ion transporter [Magnetococcales bacterium]|nr:ion transporter [Magnetococcales bacterium]